MVNIHVPETPAGCEDVSDFFEIALLSRSVIDGNIAKLAQMEEEIGDALCVIHELDNRGYCRLMAMALDSIRAAMALAEEARNQ